MGKDDPTMSIQMLEMFAYRNKEKVSRELVFHDNDKSMITIFCITWYVEWRKVKYRSGRNELLCLLGDYDIYQENKNTSGSS